MTEKNGLRRIIENITPLSQKMGSQENRYIDVFRAKPTAEEYSPGLHWGGQETPTFTWTHLETLHSQGWGCECPAKPADL